MFKINFKGGTIPTGALDSLLSIMEGFGVPSVAIGQRQNLYVKVGDRHDDAAQEALHDKSFDFELNQNEYPNIVSSIVGEDVFTTHPWVSEDMYNEILEGFNFRPKLKVNIVDPTQGLVPLFSGNINIICSKSLNFWHVYVRHVSIDGMQLYPQLIYTTEIGLFCQQLEVELLHNKSLNLDQIAERINKKYSYISIDSKEELSLGRVRFPHYEGIVPYDGKLWLGIYRRNNDFSVEFLKQLLLVCSETNIAQLHLTPWQTIAIKGIKDEHRILWEKLLGKFGVNIRHSALELNWQLPDCDPKAQELKLFLVRQFDEHDIRTYGLTFAIKTRAIDVATSVVIELRNGENKFNVLYAEDFNANKQKYIVYAEEVKEQDLVFVLERLSRKYYEQLNSNQELVKVPSQDLGSKSLLKKVMRCKHCFTIYDADYGDELNGIKAGISFTALPDDFACAICEASKSEFEATEIMVS